MLPDWFLVPFVLVAVAGLISGAILDLYSSGLTLLSLGLKIPRFVAAGIDGVLMILGTIYIVWVAADDFLGIFQGFLITLGVPMAAWCGVFLADLMLRRRDYDEPALYTARGRYGAVGWPAVIVMAVATVVGWGLVTQPFGAQAPRLAGLPARTRSASAARPANGPSPASASRSPSPSASSATCCWAPYGSGHRSGSEAGG